MVSYNRIVPITRIDYLSMIGTICKIAAPTSELKTLVASDVEGDFSVTATGTYIANQPVKSLDFAEGTPGGAVFFVADYDFVGITIAGVAVTPAEESDEIKPDAVTLYRVMLADGEIGVFRITPEITVVEDGR